MASGFPPVPVYPYALDSDYTLFLVYNTAETQTTLDTDPWAEDIPVRPRLANQTEIWGDNGFATISGEMFYYDTVDVNSNGKVCRLKRCIRNLGGKAPQFNSAGTWVRGFVIAEHHNQLVTTVLLVEQFVGENFADYPTLDWLIRNLSDGCNIPDDVCPTAQLNFNVTSPTNTPTAGNNPCAMGATATYSVIAGGSFNLQFGDGQSATTATTGTHTYAPGANIDPILVVSNNQCQTVVSPIQRNNPVTPATVPGSSTNPSGPLTTSGTPTTNSTSPPPAGPFSPAPQPMPPVVPPPNSPTPQNPPFFVPVPVPPQIPMPIIPPMQPAPPETGVPPVSFPSVRPSKKMHVPTPPTPHLPSHITITPIHLPSQINVINHGIPSRIIGPDIQIPSQVILHNVGRITFEPPPPIPPVQIMPPLIPPIPIGPMEFAGPSFISLLELSGISLITPNVLDVSLTFPSIIDVHLDFPQSIGVSVIGVPESLQLQAPGPLQIEAIPKLELNLDSFHSMMMDVGHTLADVLKQIKVEIPKPDWQLPELKVDWGTPPKIKYVVRVKKPKGGLHNKKNRVIPGNDPQEEIPQEEIPSYREEEAMFDENGWLIGRGGEPVGFFQEPIESEGLDYPDDVMISPPDIPPIQVEHNIPDSINVNAPKWDDVQLVGADNIPTEIHVIPPEQDMRISVVPFQMPDIRIDTSKLEGMAIPVKFPDEMPMLKIETDTIRVTGFPEKIIAELHVPENVRVPLFYDGPPLPVTVSLQIQGLAGEAANDITCVAIMPCPKR